jgi:hypothetical protein
MICPHCKITLEEDSVYCKKCGYHLHSSSFTNLILRKFRAVVLKINWCFSRFSTGLTNFYYQSLAKSAVQKSKYNRQDPEQRNLFRITKVHKNQKHRINSYVNEALIRGYVDYIEGWQAHRVGNKKYVVSYRYVEPTGNFKYWYWVVDFNTKMVKEITRKAKDLEKYHVCPGENTDIVNLEKMGIVGA